jgi:hypothetical protein
MRRGRFGNRTKRKLGGGGGGGGSNEAGAGGAPLGTESHGSGVVQTPAAPASVPTPDRIPQRAATWSSLSRSRRSLGY